MVEYKEKSENYAGIERVDSLQHGIVVAKNITKIYGSGTTSVAALKGVNLNVQQGEFVAVLGPSGSGKTTFLNMLGALDRPTKGQVFIDKKETSRVAERNLYRIRRGKLGFIFQTYYLVPSLNAIQNVLMPVLGELSGGEQQRVAIARALILNPPVVLADEPTGNLDTKTGAEIIDLMKRLNKDRGKTFIIVTHDRRIADAAERVFYLLDGELSDHLPEEY
jgi:putative ABC transport system ATP-binding protein